MALIKKLEGIFRNLADEKKLSHSYIFFSPSFFETAGGAGDVKLEFAEKLANYLENKKWELPASPMIDSLVIGGGIDDAREGIRFLWQKPLRSPKKVLIAPNAEDLTPEAQNAILKISEDPPEHALIILTVKNLELLLPTLLSRFQKVCVNSGDSADSFMSYKNETAAKFLRAPIIQRKEIIKDVIQDDKLLRDFVTALLIEFRRDKIKNWRLVKELLYRWKLINQFNTNKRLQLEAAILNI